MAPHSEQMKMLRVVVREDFTKSRCDALIADFKLALQTLDTYDAKKLQEHKEYVYPERSEAVSHERSMRCESRTHADMILQAPIRYAPPLDARHACLL
jgi:hypothetical protein